MRLSIVFVLLVQLVSCSRWSIEGGKVLYSANIETPVKGSNMSIDIIDISRPVVGPNGQYSDFIIMTVTDMIHKYFDSWAVKKYKTSPTSFSFVVTAVNEVFRTITVDWNIIGTAILTDLIKTYTTIAHEYNRKSLVLEANSEDFNFRAKKVMVCTIIVLECCLRAIKLTQTQNLILLEFLYRFGINGSRYELAFQYLYTSIDNDNLKLAYTMLVDKFDPNRKALPVLYIQSCNESEFLKDHLIEFILKLSDKVLQIDPIAEFDNFNRHAAMCISSMISGSFLTEAYISKVIEMLPLIDMSFLVKSPRFAHSTSRLIQILVDDQMRLLDSICIHLFKDNLILNLDTSNSIHHGSIFSALNIYQNLFSLSDEAYNRLGLIEFEFSEYARKVEFCSIFKDIETTFLDMDDDQLSILKTAITGLIPFLPIYFEHDPNDASTIVYNLNSVIKKLVNSSLRCSDKSLDVERYTIFIKLIEATMSLPTILSTIIDSFSGVLMFFNTRLADQLFFFNDLKHRIVLFNYFQKVAPITAEESMNNIFGAKLEMNDEKFVICSDLIRTSKKLKLNFNPILIKFIVEEIQKYLTTSPRLPIQHDQYLALVDCAKLFIREQILSKSEEIMVRSILKI